MIRSAVVGLLAAAVIGILGPIGLFLAWVTGSARPLYAIAIASLRFLLRVAGIRLRVRGLDRLRPGVAYMFVANHVSNLDPPVALVASGRDVRTLGKTEVFKIPILGTVIRRAGFPAIDRNDREQAIAALDQAVEGLRHGYSFLAFPEGTRSRSGELGPFKKGPFVMALKSGAPMAPMIIRGTRPLMPPGRLRLRPGAIEVEVLEPVPTQGLGIGERDRLRDEVWSRMQAAQPSRPADLQ